MRERIVVICPGRGSYTKDTLGYLQKYRPEIDSWIQTYDEMRNSRGEVSISELDSQSAFKTAMHMRGENASILIHACAMSDFLSIDQDRFEVVAVTGNSMGWYIALAVAGALGAKEAFDVINTMGSMMKDSIIGGQMIYPTVNSDWVKSDSQVDTIAKALKVANESAGAEAYDSIYLGGYRVLGGNSEGLKALTKLLPKLDDYPFQLAYHAAFHTPLMKPISERGFSELDIALFSRPQLPLVDGRGKIWQPYSSRLEELYQYTLGHQVVEPYDFTAAIRTALREFAPDRLVLLGPGNTLGGSIGQILIQEDWMNLKSKSDFVGLQKRNPFLLSMGVSEQAAVLQSVGKASPSLTL